MRSKLSPDGGKIRLLRTRQGWTQEQLAEIAGVSCRTIQRAETGGGAAFETVRALAGAFGVDFDQLLGSDTREVPAAAFAADPLSLSVETSSPVGPVPSARRTWTTLLVVATAIAAGMLAGGMVVYQFHAPSGPQLTIPQLKPPIAVRSHDSRRQETAAVRKMLRSNSNTAASAKTPDWGAGSAAMRPGTENAALPVEVVALAEPVPPITVPASMRSESFDLPLPKNLVPIVATDDVRGPLNPVIPHPGGFTRSDQGTGAVRGSMRQAARKTGEAITKAGASVRRVF